MMLGTHGAMARFHGREIGQLVAEKRSRGVRGKMKKKMGNDIYSKAISRLGDDPAQ
jgi:hypothetical protein